MNIMLSTASVYDVSLIALFLLVIIRLGVSLYDVYLDRKGSNEQTFSKLLHKFPDEAFFQAETHFKEAKSVDKYKRMVLLTKVIVALLSCVMIGLLWSMHTKFADLGLKKAVYYICVMTLLVYVLFDQATSRKIRKKEMNIYEQLVSEVIPMKIKKRTKANMKA